jgi:F-type H+-transporting ATPase subunit c
MLRKVMTNCTSFAVVMLSSGLAFAQDGGSDSSHWRLVAIALAIGAAAFGGTLGQSRTASAALESIGRNPNAADKIFVPMLLGLAFIESLVLFTWLMMFLLK